MNNDALLDPEPCEDRLQTSLSLESVTPTVAATFDTPLPLSELQWKTFERFCVSLLQCLHPEAEIHLYGGEGHNQLGIDLRRRNDGEVWTFQAKQKKVFRPSDIRKIVAAHKVVSQKKIILLSIEASPAVRDEVDIHSDWEIWDQEDLSEKLQSACELLWELARSDSRDTQHHPNHPLRVLQELARPVVLHSQHDVKAVVAFALRLLPAAESWTGICTPFALLEGALITTTDHLQSKPGRPMEIVTQVYRVNPGAVRPLRRQVIDAILNSLSSANRRQAFAAADLLEHAVRYPDGWPELPLSDPEKAYWTEEFQDTLQRLNAMLDLHNLPAPVLVRVAQSVARYSFHTNGHLCQTLFWPQQPPPCWSDWIGICPPGSAAI
jgi:glutaredoxin-related protein